MENRPSVLKGDHLFVSPSSHTGDNAEKARHYEYKGYVHEVHASQVCLGFNQKYFMFSGYYWGLFCLGGEIIMGISWYHSETTSHFWIKMFAYLDSKWNRQYSERCIMQCWHMY